MKISPMKINLNEKFKKFNQYWHPYILGELNDNHIKIARLKGEFVWHQHTDEDELFIVIQGTLLIDFPDRTETVSPGEIIIVPKGVEHRPRTKGDEEVQIMLVEPKSTRHTGDNITDRTVIDQKWV